MLSLFEQKLCAARISTNDLSNEALSLAVPLFGPEIFSYNTRMFSGCTDSIPSKLEWVAARQLDGLVIEDISPNIYVQDYVQKCVQKKMCSKTFASWVLSQSKLALLPWLGRFRCSSLTAIAIGRICAAAPIDGARRTCRRTTSTTLDRGAMMVSVVLGAGAGCPLQHMEKVAATGMVLVLDVGC